MKDGFFERVVFAVEMALLVLIVFIFLIFQSETLPFDLFLIAFFFLINVLVALAYIPLPCYKLALIIWGTVNSVGYFVLQLNRDWVCDRVCRAWDATIDISVTIIIAMNVFVIIGLNIGYWVLSNRKKTQPNVESLTNTDPVVEPIVQTHGENQAITESIENK